MTTRWLISGSFKTTAPMHLGTGADTEHPQIVDEDKKPCDVSAVVDDHRGFPCMPGTAIKGVLRAWADSFLTGESRRIERIFGSRDVDLLDAEAGWAEFTTAMIEQPTRTDLERFEEYVPYWRPEHLTGIASNVCISRFTGAAQAKKLFYQEFVPEGVSFSVEIAATRLTDDEIALLLAILEEGSTHASHPYQFGANGADGWGRADWSPKDVKRWNASTGPSFATASVGFACCAQSWQRPATPKPTISVPAHAFVELELDFQGPFLVNDASRAKTDEMSEEEKSRHTNFTPLRRADGSAWLPASSFRGAIRQRAEFLLRSLNPDATGDPNESLGDGPIERIFGQTSQAARLTIEEFVQTKPPVTRKQDFVAIDRFTGGAADGAKFDAIYADSPTLRTKLVLDLDGLERQDVALLALALRDVCLGKVTFGFGAGKGYGEARGKLTLVSCSGVPRDWQVPASACKGMLDTDGIAWLNDSLQGLPRLPAPPAHAELARGEGPAAPAAAPPPSTPPVVKQGTLGWQGAGKKRRRVLNVPNQTLPLQINRPDALAPSLSGNQDEGIAVDFELERGQAVRIRPAGEPWGAAAGAAGAAASAKGGRFIHPYYFLPLADRAAFRGDLADSRPIGHERLQAGRYTGTIGVRLTTRTPLLICDDERPREHNGHKTYDMRTENGKPLVMSSSVRGMLRSSYEAITNSRFGVFPGEPISDKPAEKQGTRRGFRLPANAGLVTVPVRIVRHNGALAAELLPGTSTVGNDGRAAPGDPLYAAWCGSYPRGSAAWRPGGLSAFGHRDWVWAYLTPWHYRRPISRGAIEFDFWNVEDVRPAGGAAPAAAPPATDLRRAFGRSAPAGWGSPGWRQGYLCVTGLNMSNKHDERVFFTSAPSPIRVPLEKDTIEQWRQLIQDYQREHEREIQEGATGPPALPGCSFSRHIAGNAARPAAAEQDLSQDDLCYAEVAKVGGTWRIRGLYPVMISRKLYEKSPLDLLPSSLRPAKAIPSLSPADRVFGWVSQDAAADDPEPAYRGQLRVGPITCITEDAVALFPERTLAILAQPKPQQGRFYLGQANGSAQPKGRGKEGAGYGGTNRIRGPKVYPHHCEFAEATWRGGERSNQNRSITGWVKPDTSFELKLHVENLTRVELGALVWLLSLPADHYLRMGLGKPLGFGSIRAEFLPDATRVADGSAWAASLVAWDSPPPAAVDLDAAKREFEAAIKAANPAVLPAFLKAAAGFAGSPVHYPRLDTQQAGDGEHYRWFVANEKGEQLPLPDLTPGDPSLPRLSGK
jgi:CRISPR/Cas system CSM-associated protein Csm3 (group 7 of RAMP superfamily)